MQAAVTGSSPAVRHGIQSSLRLLRAHELIVADVHARPHVLVGLLRALGAVDKHCRRTGGWWVVQVGDLLDAQAPAGRNLQTARLALQTMDVVLAGNHELRLFGDAPDGQGAALATLASRGWPQAATACDDWLVTHAGVHPRLATALPDDARGAALAINDRWNRRGRERGTDPWFAAVGPHRGGRAPHGGIMWLHTDEWPADQAAPWGQIAGHVPQPEPRLLAGRRWLIDLGTGRERIGALVRAAGGEWSPVVYDGRRRALSAREPGVLRAA
jgi:hypothetical protein